MISAMQMPKRFFSAIIAVSFLNAIASAQSYNVQTSVTDSNGNVMATATTRFTVPVANPTTQTSAAPVPSSPAAAAAPSLPGMAGQVYESDRWLAVYPKDANGFTQFPVPTNACIVSTASTPGHQASDFATFQAASDAAVANGSLSVLFRDGGVYTNNQITPGVINDNIQIPGGSQPIPVLIGRIGRNGVSDHSLPRPVMLQGFGIGGKRYTAAVEPMHYVIVFGLDFYGDQRDPASPTYNATNATNGWYQSAGLNFVDSGGGPSDHFWVEDCRFRYMQVGVSFQSTQSYPLSTLIFRRNVVDHCYGAKFGGYDYHVHDLLVVDSVFDHNGWEQTVSPKTDIQGREHNWYTAVNPPNETIDPQHRFIDVVFCRADSEGYEGDDGGLADTVLYLANPIGGYLGVYQSLFHNVVVDGGGGEFDTDGPGSGLSMGPSGTAEKASAYNRGWGIFTDCATTCTFDTVTCINKPENINCGNALAVNTSDTPKGLASFATQANLVNCKVDNWFVWSGDPNQSSPNVVGINNGPAATITYSGCYFPGVTNIAGVTGTVPAYVDPTRCASSYARTLGVAAIKDGPSLLDAMDSNWSGNWDNRLLATSAVNWIQPGFALKQ